MAEKFDPLGAWKPVSERSEIDNRWLRVKNVTFELPNGEVVTDYYIVEKPPVAVVIPFQDGKTYLIKEWERGTGEVGYKWPGGRVDNGETAEAAAARELREELGKKGKLTHLGTSHVDPGLMPTTADYFFCDDLEDQPEGRVDDPTELFTGEWVDFSEVVDSVATNKIKNSFVIVGLALASNHLTRSE